MSVIDDVEVLIHQRPGLTEVQIAETVLGNGARQQRVNPSCRQLVKEGQVERHGRGGPGEPFTYYAKGAR